MAMTESRRFWLFALGQVLLWCLLPTLICHNLPLDVVEGLAWGHGWPLGTYKHPPLQAWLLEMAAVVGGHSDFGIYALSAACLGLTYAALWRLGQVLMTPASARFGVMLLASCFYFATAIPEFNPNVVQLPLYALCGLFFWRAYQRNRWQDWLLLGLCGGLGLWGKYSFAVLLAGFGVFALIEPTARRLWRAPGAWLAAVVAGLVFLPHLLWLIQNDWLPLTYAKSRTETAQSLWQGLGWTMVFGLNQLLVIAPVILIAWLARQKLRSGITEKTIALHYLAVMAWSPLGLILLLALLLGDRPRDMWGMAFWPFIGLWAAGVFHSAWDQHRWARWALVGAIVMMPLAFTAGVLLSSPLGFRPWRTSFPGREMAQAADALWQAQGWHKPMRVVMGENWYGGNIAWYGQDRPQVMMGGNPEHSPWVTPEMVRKSGALIVWDPRGVTETFPGWAVPYGQPVAQTIVQLPYGRDTIPVALAIVAPQK